MTTTSMLTLRTDRAHNPLWPRVVATCLVAALLVGGLPSSVGAAWRDRSSELPGMTSSGTVIAIAAVGGAAVVALVILAKKKGDKEVAFEVEPPKFPDETSGPVAAKASIANKTKATMTVTQLSLEGDSGTWSLPDGLQAPFTVAAGERVDVTVSYDPAAPGQSKKKAHLRVVAAAPQKKDTVRVVSFSGPNGQPESSSYPDLPEGIILPQR